MSEVGVYLSGLSRFSDGLPTLERLLCRSRYRHQAHQSYEQSLCGLFGLSGQATEPLPVAALTALIDQPAGSDDHAIWIRVDPVHLRADLKHVFLFDSSQFELNSEESAQFRALLDEVFSARGLRLVAGASPDHWYLQLEQLPEMTTQTLSQVRGRDVLSCLPSGAESTGWRTLANEVQMTLHECELNQARENRGQMPINGVWIWGQGELKTRPEKQWDRVYARDSLSAALAEYSGAEYLSDRQAKLAEIVSGVERLLIVNPVDTDLVGLEEDWLQPLATQLAKGQIKRLNLYSEDIHFTASRFDYLRFWKRPQLLSAQLKTLTRNKPA